MPGGRTLRILVARPDAGVPDDDPGAKRLARALSDGGIEVVFAGSDQTPEMIAVTAVQEAVDAIGLAMGSHTETAADAIAAVESALGARGAGGVLVFDGNVVPANEIAGWVESDLRARVG